MIQETVVNKIKELGEEAPAYFGKTKAVITKWLNNPDLIPLSAVSKVIEDSQVPLMQDTPEEAEDRRETEMAEGVMSLEEERRYERFISPAGIKQIHDAIDDVYAQVHGLNTRLQKAEELLTPAYTVPQPQVINAQGIHQPVPSPVHDGIQSGGPRPPIIGVNPNEQNAGSMTRPGREPEMRVVPPRIPGQNIFAPTQQEAYAQPQPAPVQPTAMPPSIPRGGGWLSPHRPKH